LHSTPSLSLNADEVRRLNAFHGAIFELLRQSENVLYAGVGFPYSDCSRYTNLATNAMAGMLATARLLNDESKVNAVLFALLSCSTPGGKQGHDRCCGEPFRPLS
jgi:hypothetical protein